MSLSDRALRTMIVGGGPAGLLYAALARRRYPRHDVTVLERNAPDATFGFGVVFSSRTLAGLRDADPTVHEAIDAASQHWTDIEIRHRGEVLRCGGHAMAAIARTRLLSILQRQAHAAGADLRFETEARAAELAQADLLLAADGVNSGMRQAAASAFGPEVDRGRAKYIWFATTTRFDALTFAFVEDEHGWWGVHAYPFDEQRSTFIVETDEATWRRAGLDRAGELAPGETDRRSLAFCEALFAPHLSGGGLLGNNSQWLTFGTLRTARWHAGRTVLLGDAAHTAHFSVGSGTKMAMEDAIALADAVGPADDVAAALASYERARRPQVEHIQDAALPSLIWWERFRDAAAHRTPASFAFHFLSRSPVVTRERLRARDPRFMRAVEPALAEQLGAPAADAPLAAPFAARGLRLRSRVAAAPALADARGEDDVVALAGCAAAGAGLVLALPGAARGDAAHWRRAADAVHRAGAAFALAGAGAQVALDAGADVLVGPAVTLADAGLERLGDALEPWPEDRPLLLPLLAAEPLREEGAAEVRALGRLAARRSLLIAVVASDDSEASLGVQSAACDVLRAEIDAPLALVDPPTADLAATAVLAGRADLCLGVPRLDTPRWGACAPRLTHVPA